MRDAGRIARLDDRAAGGRCAEPSRFRGGDQAARHRSRCPSTRAPSSATSNGSARGSPRSSASGLAQHPAFVSVDEARVRAGQPSVWNEAAVTQAARTLRADDAVFGQSSSARHRPGDPAPAAGGQGRRRCDVVALEPVTVPEGELLARLVPLPATYARTMKVTLTDAEARRMEKAAQPTRLLKAFELYARGAGGGRRAAGPGGQRAGGGSAGARRSRPTRTSCSPSTRWGASIRRSATAGRRRRSSAPRRSSTRPIRSPTRRWATCSWPRPAGSSTRRSRPTRRRSTCARSTPTPTWASARPRRPRVTWTAPSAPTPRRWRPIR